MDCCWKPLAWVRYSKILFSGGLSVINAARLHIHKEMDNGGVWGAEDKSGL